MDKIVIDYAIENHLEMINEMMTNIQCSNKEIVNNNLQKLSSYIMHELIYLDNSLQIQIVEKFNSKLKKMVLNDIVENKILAIDVVLMLLQIDIECYSSGSIYYFINIIQSCMNSTDEYLMNIIAYAIGVISSMNKTLFELRILTLVLNWIISSSQHKYIFGIKVIRQVIIACPYIFIEKIKDYYKYILKAMKYSKENLLETCLTALESALRITSHFEKTCDVTPLYNAILLEIQKPLPTQKSLPTILEDEWILKSVYILKRFLVVAHKSYTNECSHIEKCIQYKNYNYKFSLNKHNNFINENVSSKSQLIHNRHHPIGYTHNPQSHHEFTDFDIEQSELAFAALQDDIVSIWRLLIHYTKTKNWTIMRELLMLFPALIVFDVELSKIYVEKIFQLYLDGFNKGHGEALVYLGLYCKNLGKHLPHLYVKKVFEFTNKPSKVQNKTTFAHGIWYEIYLSLIFSKFVIRDEKLLISIVDGILDTCSIGPTLLEAIHEIYISASPKICESIETKLLLISYTILACETFDDEMCVSESIKSEESDENDDFEYDYEEDVDIREDSCDDSVYKNEMEPFCEKIQTVHKPDFEVDKFGMNLSRRPDVANGVDREKTNIDNINHEGSNTIRNKTKKIAYSFDSNISRSSKLSESSSNVVILGNSCTPKTNFTFQNEMSSLEQFKVNLKKYNVNNEKNIETALDILIKFNFDSSKTLPHLKKCYSHYLVHTNRNIRIKTMKTCKVLIIPLINSLLGDYGAIYNIPVIDNVVKGMIQVAITDSDWKIRHYSYCTLIDPIIYHYIAYQEYVDLFKFSLYDTVFEVREVALCLIGHLITINRTIIISTLTGVVTESIRHFMSTGLIHSKIETVKLLTHVTFLVPTFIIPYASIMVSVIVNRLIKSPNCLSKRHLLASLGNLVEIIPEKFFEKRKKVLHLLYDNLQNSNSDSIIQINLWTLNQFVEFTDCDMYILKEFPQILILLDEILMANVSTYCKRMILRIIGCIGAIDPKVFTSHVKKVDDVKITFLPNNQVTESDSDFELVESMNISSFETVASLSKSNLSFESLKLDCTYEYDNLEEYSTHVCFYQLLNIFSNENLVSETSSCFLSIKNIICYRSKYLDKYLPYLMKAILGRIDKLNDLNAQFVIINLASIIKVVGSKIADYVDPIFIQIKKFWNLKPNMRNSIIDLIKEIGFALKTMFSSYVHHVMPFLMKLFKFDESENRTVTCQALLMLRNFYNELGYFFQFVVTTVTDLIYDQNSTINLRETAIITLKVFLKHTFIKQYIVIYVHVIIFILNQVDDNHVKNLTLSLLYATMKLTNKNFKIFIPIIESCLVRNRIDIVEFEYHLIFVYQPMNFKVGAEKLVLEEEPIQISPDKPPEDVEYVRNEQLDDFWYLPNFTHTSEWENWFNSLYVGLIITSSSTAIKACMHVSSNVSRIAKRLFHISFLTNWLEYNDDNKRKVVSILEKILATSDNKDFIRDILNLVQFFNRTKYGPLPIKHFLCAKSCEVVSFTSQALYHLEEMFRVQPTQSLLIQIIDINMSLQNRDAARGALYYAQYCSNIEIPVYWYEKLEVWTLALNKYMKLTDGYLVEMTRSINESLEDNTIIAKHIQECIHGQMRCAKSLGKWDDLLYMADNWVKPNSSVESEIAYLVTLGSWKRDNYYLMSEYLKYVIPNTFDYHFFSAFIFALKLDYIKSSQHIEQCRDIIYPRVVGKYVDNYTRIYTDIINLQVIVELEECIELGEVKDTYRSNQIKRKWDARLKEAEKNMIVWNKILEYRKDSHSSEKNLDSILDFSELCQLEGRFNLASTILESMKNTKLTQINREFIRNENVRLTMESIKVLWSQDCCEEAIKSMELFLIETISIFENRLNLPPADPEFANPLNSEGDMKIQISPKLRSKACILLSSWKWSLRPEEPLNVIKYYEEASRCDFDSYETLSKLASIYYSTALGLLHKHVLVNSNSKYALSTDIHLEQLKNVSKEDNDNYIRRDTIESENDDEKSQHYKDILAYCISALRNFFCAIRIDSNNALQDTLRILTLWFDFGNTPIVYKELCEGIQAMHVENWLQVIPQLIARIGTERTYVNQLIMQTLLNIGKLHPQAIIYSLVVATKSENKLRLAAADNLIHCLKRDHNKIVTEAIMISRELVRIANLWHEQISAKFDEISRISNDKSNQGKITKVLSELNSIISQKPETRNESDLQEIYANPLREAYLIYKSSQNSLFDDNHYNNYIKIIKKLTNQFKRITYLKLTHVSPLLAKIKEMDLAVPGTYNSSNKIVRICKIYNDISIINSKQRPRKICMLGSDGKDYSFLLKGNEDIRQDERIMQLFKLINSFLASNLDTARTGLSIERYDSIPLSPNFGLIGWIHDCDTIHSLIKEYRIKNSVLIDIEHRILLQITHDYDQLTLIQKVYAFEIVLSNVGGNDLAKIMFNRSVDAQTWFENRRVYTTSLATMSMVGYILGLGDRHPSNIMINRKSGKIVHIDFGDCFEVAMHREKYPEKIPFRLTRMFVRAMEVTGINGTYILTCERVLKVLRTNNESILAVLEAFVYDPLFNWQNVHNSSDEENNVQGVMNKVSMVIIKRVRDKLRGCDFGEQLSISKQVEFLVKEASSHRNICQCYIGWCPFW
ncbi:Target of rapamycin [Intoshia linei]|uniref:Serine/threonine-protein kinase TOR n=1 Tax=Intoshia linei TaxID=1819745 RepID=A0A177B4J1_9BILA|nr:Target of rapamycin [Intoshia linei]